jgi:hypothetical protein
MSLEFGRRNLSVFDNLLTISLILPGFTTTAKNTAKGPVDWISETSITFSNKSETEVGGLAEFTANV